VGWAAVRCGWAPNEQELGGHAGRRFSGGPIFGIRACGGSVVEIVGRGLIEREVWDRFRLGEVKRGCLIQQEVALRRSTSRRQGRRKMVEVEMEENS